MSNMTFLYGTTNRAKLEVMERATQTLEIDIITLNDIICGGEYEIRLWI